MSPRVPRPSPSGKGARFRSPRKEPRVGRGWEKPEGVLGTGDFEREGAGVQGTGLHIYERP